MVNADAQILAALNGIKVAQIVMIEVAYGSRAEMGTAFREFQSHYDKLPPAVARRLTEIDPKAVRYLSSPITTALTGEGLKQFSDRIASTEALLQVVRAITCYQARDAHGF